MVLFLQCMMYFTFVVNLLGVSIFSWKDPHWVLGCYTMFIIFVKSEVCALGNFIVSSYANSYPEILHSPHLNGRHLDRILTVPKGTSSKAGTQWVSQRCCCGYRLSKKRLGTRGVAGGAGFLPCSWPLGQLSKKEEGSASLGGTTKHPPTKISP